MINVEIDTTQLMAALSRISNATNNLRPALLKIGEQLIESTQQRFIDTKGPDGDLWARNKPSTLQHKQGTRPLTDSGNLGSTITKQMTDNNTLVVGSPMEYAAMMHFGGKKSEFAYLWNDIPARPFLGISDQDNANIEEIVTEYISSVIHN